MKIDEYKSIEINNLDQWIFICGDDSKPVLLLLHGGPGTPSMNLFRKWNKPLMDDFLLVSWDQRGTGRSNPKDLDEDTLNVNQLVEDTHWLTSYLKERFKREKIYILGHSFGSTLAMKTISRYPEDYEAYFGVSQFVNATDNEMSCYKWVKDEAQRRGDKKALSILNKAGEPVDGFYKDGLKSTMKVKQLVGKYKGDSKGKSSTLTILLGLLFCREYRGRNLSKAISGINLSLMKIGNDLRGIDFPSEITELKIPVYFFSGDYDQLTPQHLLRDYFPKLKAPRKELFTFSESAHSPLWEERDKFHQIMHDLMK